MIGSDPRDAGVTDRGGSNRDGHAEGDDDVVGPAVLQIQVWRGR